jgi:hypothetical protein
MLTHTLRCGLTFGVRTYGPRLMSDFTGWSSRNAHVPDFLSLSKCLYSLCFLKNYLCRSVCIRVIRVRLLTFPSQIVQRGTIWGWVFVLGSLLTAEC